MKIKGGMFLFTARKVSCDCLQSWWLMSCRKTTSCLRMRIICRYQKCLDANSFLKQLVCRYQKCLDANSFLKQLVWWKDLSFTLDHSHLSYRTFLSSVAHGPLYNQTSRPKEVAAKKTDDATTLYSLECMRCRYSLACSSDIGAHAVLDLSSWQFHVHQDSCTLTLHN